MILQVHGQQDLYNYIHVMLNATDFILPLLAKLISATWIFSTGGYLCMLSLVSLCVCGILIQVAGHSKRMFPFELHLATTFYFVLSFSALLNMNRMFDNTAVNNYCIIHMSEQQNK